MRKIILVLIALHSAVLLYSQDMLSMDLTGEAGFTAIVKHEIQTGTNSDKGDVFNYLTQGNQDTLFPTARYQADLSINNRHHLIFLYQPLTIITQAPVESDFQYNGDTFTGADGILDLKYGFDFWRASYLYELIEPPRYYLSLGASLQIRNASILFQSETTGKGSVTDNIGPVPILKVKTGYRWDSGLFAEFEGDGFYASSAIFNGSGYPFVGYIYDLSVRGGYRFKEDLSVYLGVRFLGGGALGTNDEEQFTYNDLHTAGAHLGAVLHL